MKPSQFTKAFILAAQPIDRSRDYPCEKTLAHGFCYYYAYVFSQVMGGDLYTYMTPDKAGHAFIKYRGRYYDGDSLRGQKDWRDLQPYLKRADKRYLKKDKPQTFLKKWWVDNKGKKIFKEVIKMINLNRIDFGN